MSKSAIPYCTHTWNPVTGCTPVGAGCEHCWAKATAERFPQTHAWLEGNMEADWMPVPFSRVTLHPERLSEPAHWRKARVVLVCAMGDLFHQDVPFRFLADTFVAIGETRSDTHTWLILTKRPNGMREFFAGATKYIPGWPWGNVWAGTSIWDQESADRAVPLLRETPAAHRWLSIEPLLGPIDRLDLRGIEQVIVGAESLGNRPGRECDIHWIEHIRVLSIEASVPCYVKQYHGVGKMARREPGPGELAWGERL